MRTGAGVLSALDPTAPARRPSTSRSRHSRLSPALARAASRSTSRTPKRSRSAPEPIVLPARGGSRIERASIAPARGSVREDLKAASLAALYPDGGPATDEDIAKVGVQVPRS